MRKMLLAATGIAVGLNLIPIATLANDHDLVCYMVTGRGDVIDLGSFCRRDFNQQELACLVLRLLILQGA